MAFENLSGERVELIEADFLCRRRLVTNWNVSIDGLAEGRNWWGGRSFVIDVPGTGTGDGGDDAKSNAVELVGR